MTRTTVGMATAVVRAIAYNARCLGEAPTINVHYLKDGRVRVFDLDKGWRTRPYREYNSVGRAYQAAMQSVVDSRRVRAQLAVGKDKLDASRRVTDARRAMPWPVRP